jgi:hypothetical protein
VGAVFALAVVTAYVQGCPLDGPPPRGAGAQGRDQRAGDRDPASMQESAAATDRPEGGRPSAPVP